MDKHQMVVHTVGGRTWLVNIERTGFVDLVLKAESNGFITLELGDGQDWPTMVVVPWDSIDTIVLHHDGRVVGR